MASFINQANWNFERQTCPAIDRSRTPLHRLHRHSRQPIVDWPFAARISYWMQMGRIWFGWAARRTHRPPKRQWNVSTSVTLRLYKNRIIPLNAPITTKIVSTWMRPNTGASICWRANWQRRTCHARFIANWENVPLLTGENVPNYTIQSKWTFAQSKLLITPSIPAAVVVIVSFLFPDTWEEPVTSKTVCYRTM